MWEYRQEGSMGSEKDMLRYVRTSVVLKILFVLTDLIISVIAISMALRGMSSGENMLLVLFILSVGLFLGWAAFTPFLEDRKMINFLKDNGIYNDAVYDFSSAQPFLNDRIRLGSKYVFGKRCCSVLRYTDICRLFLYTVEANDIERSKQLRAVDNSGKVWRLCALDLHIENEPGLAEVLDFMSHKNSRIVVDSLK
ncbi:MAG: hypothetical protein IJQ15_08580 [Synergistaceae bacterium]|nr:hypothetical protein [Synergistaceae bacterium]